MIFALSPLREHLFQIWESASKPWRKMYSHCVYTTHDPQRNPHFPHGYPQDLGIKPRVLRGFSRLSTCEGKMYKNYPQTSVYIGLIPFKFDGKICQTKKQGSYSGHNLYIQGGEKPLSTGVLWLSSALNIPKIFLNITKVFLLHDLNAGIHQRRPAAMAFIPLISMAVSSA